jgi:type I restriction enzyme S subunit
MKRYKEYKKTGMEWINEIPKGWKTEKLRNIGRFTSSGIDKKIKEDECLIKIINYTDVYGNKSLLLNSDRKYMEVSCPVDKILNHQVKIGDLIFTPSSETIEDIGISALVNEELPNVAYSYHVLRFRFDIEVVHRYKKYLCNNNIVLNYFSSEARGTTRKILNRENFKSAVVILPPINEQTEIANFLDEKTVKIDELISNKQKLIELLKEEKTALINNAVTKGINYNVKIKLSSIEWMKYIPEHWVIKRLKYLAKIQSSNVDKKTAKDEISVKLCNYIDVYKNDYIDMSISFMEASATQKEIDKFILIKNDVLITKDSETPDDIACPALVVSDFEDVICGYHLAQIRPNNNDLIGEYLFRLFQSKDFNIHFESSANGVTRYGLPLNSITDVYIPIPPQKEQFEICKYINNECQKIDLTILKIEKEIVLLQEYKNVLISESVTGKIKVI